MKLTLNNKSEEALNLARCTATDMKIDIDYYLKENITGIDITVDELIS